MIGSYVELDQIGLQIPDLQTFLDSVDTNMTRAFLPWILRNPRYLRTFARFHSVYSETRKLRAKNAANGVVVPPFLILSVTPECNLRCAGCYASSNGIIGGGKTRGHLNASQWRRVIEEAKELGVMGFIVAGGEPFVFPGLVDLLREFEDRFFLIVTNGTAVNEEDFRKLGKSTNIGVVVSLEGDRESTDFRRGIGVYDSALSTIRRLSHAGLLTGVSVTVSGANVGYWMEEGSIDALISKGVRLCIFIEYVPNSMQIAEAIGGDCKRSAGGLTSGARELHALSSGEAEQFRSCVLKYRSEKPIYIIHSPADEAFFGGCVSTAKGFAHVSPNGDLTPCPICNLATHNLASSSLEDGLRSQLFIKIRESGVLSTGHSKSCALASHPEEIEAIAREVGAYRSGEK